MTVDLAKLAAPFPVDKVHWRVGSTTSDKRRGMALAYIDARDVMERLDEACGPDGWQRRYVDAGNGRTCCEVGVRLNDEWVWKSDGAGDTDYEGEKGAFSDAFKRAAVNWGVGRYLYDLDAPWVEIEQKGRSAVIKHSELPKLAAVLNGYVTRMSAYEAREVINWEKIESAIRDAKKDAMLDKIAARVEANVKAWPEQWVESARELIDARRAELAKVNGEDDPEDTALFVYEAARMALDRAGTVPALIQALKDNADPVADYCNDKQKAAIKSFAEQRKAELAADGVMA